MTRAKKQLSCLRWVTKVQLTVNSHHYAEKWLLLTGKVWKERATHNIWRGKKVFNARNKTNRSSHAIVLPRGGNWDHDNVGYPGYPRSQNHTRWRHGTLSVGFSDAGVAVWVRCSRPSTCNIFHFYSTVTQWICCWTILAIKLCQSGTALIDTAKFARLALVCQLSIHWGRNGKKNPQTVTVSTSSDEKKENQKRNVLNANWVRNNVRIEPRVGKASVGRCVPCLDRGADGLQVLAELFRGRHADGIVQVLHLKLAQGIGALGAEQPRHDHRVQRHCFRWQLMQHIAFRVAFLQ